MIGGGLGIAIGIGCGEEPSGDLRTVQIVDQNNTPIVDENGEPVTTEVPKR
jgi:hypothetical protein